MPRPASRLAAVAVLTSAFACAPAAGQALRAAPEPPTSIEVQARVIHSFKLNEPDQRRFGQLEFRGGLELTSPYRKFGGISALQIRADGGRFVALTDKSNWFTGRIVYESARPVGIADTIIAPMLGPGGIPLAGRGWYDTEALADDGQGTFYVGIERVNRIVKFDFGRYGVLARADPIPTPPGIQTLPNNLGIEGLAFVPKGLPLSGMLIALSERGLDSAGNIRGFLIGLMGRSTHAEFTVRRTDGFDISDCAVLPSGNLLLLERRYSWTTGVAIRVRRIPLASIKPGAVVDGPMLLFADMGFEIDNMESLAVHRSEQGETVLTLLSDDNFSRLQRTLLLQFTLVDE